MSDRITVLVTGGAGFIGGNFVRTLLECDQYRVINLDLLTYAGHMATLGSVIKSPDHVFVQGDIADKNLTAELLSRYRPAWVVNLAAESHVDRSIDSPSAFVSTNVVGTFNLLEAVRHYWKSLRSTEQDKFRFLQVSTDEVYGSLGVDGLFTENTPYAPNSPYAASKAASDHFVRAYFHTYGLPIVITNCSNNYGPYQFPEKFIPLMILNALDGKALPVYGDGRNVRDWLYVEDHCDGIVAVLKGGRLGEKYNIGGHNERTNVDVVRTLCKLLDELLPDSPHRPHHQLIQHVSDRPGHDRRYAVDSSKLVNELGWRATRDFESGLRRTLEWYLDNRNWCAEVMRGAYGGERLGLGVTHSRTEGQASV